MSTQSRPRLFLVDASQIFYQAHYAMARRPIRSPGGLNVSVTSGSARFLQRLIDRHAPEYLAFVLDSGDSGRTALHPGYKQDREGMPDDLRAALPLTMELVEAMGVALVSLDGYEADDVIGTLARRAGREGLDTVIVSGDKDLLQLITADVSVLNPGRGGPHGTDEHWVAAGDAVHRLGVAPGKVIDYLALVGDASDNVPGAPGIGPKTAVDLLARFGDLDGVIANAEAVGGKRGRALREMERQIRMSQQLVTIRCDLPIALAMDDLRPRAADPGRLTDVLQETGLEALGDLLGLPARAATPVEPPVRRPGGRQLSLF